MLVVAADDSVMPQTVEAISHAKNAGVPVVVASTRSISRCNPGKVTPSSRPWNRRGTVRRQHAVDAYLGKKGTNVTELLDQILLQAELLD